VIFSSPKKGRLCLQKKRREKRYDFVSFRNAFTIIFPHALNGYQVMVLRVVPTTVAAVSSHAYTDTSRAWRTNHRSFSS
jgi:hypothetical protein